MKDKILVLDYGTTALKAVLYDGDFNAVCVKSFEFCYSYPAPNHIEYPAERYIEAAQELLAQIVSEQDCGGEIAALTVTGQAETLISVDKQGNVLGNAIVWTDTRAIDEVQYLSQQIPSDEYYGVTGISGLDPVVPLAKIMWIKKHLPRQYERTDKFLMLHDFVVWKLSGVIGGEKSVYACSGYLDIRRQEYCRKFLDIASIDINKLPPLSDAEQIMGELVPEFAAAIGVKDALVINGMLDQCASAIGCGNITPGTVCETTGTVLAIAATLPGFEPESFPSPVIVLPHGLKGRYLALPYCPTAGILLKWYKDNFLLSDLEKCRNSGKDIYTLINEEIEKRGAPITDLIVLPHFNGYLSPVSNPDAVGVMYGLKLDTDRFQVAHAVMEGIAFLLRENLELLERSGIKTESVISLGGGAKSELWLHLKSDICHTEFVTMANEESTSLGCALGAALAAGMLKSEDDIYKYTAVKNRYVPDGDRLKKYEGKYQKYLELNRRLGFCD
ncbi:MAG: hypothetical protein IJE90_07085 [Clostridia bacterium]|nr:hypothetical protein [Clostridia bacterium]